MKTNSWRKCLLSFLMMGSLVGASANGAGVPDYRGKVILVVDSSLLQNSAVVTAIATLTDDLVGDGWRVLRHDVARGVEPPSVWAPIPSPNVWYDQVRTTRALIKADYDAAPGEVKAVFLLGRVPVPYSGNNSRIVGSHGEWQGAHPADKFYGEMTSGYGSYWTDSIVSNLGSFFSNGIGDGRFDENYLPSDMELSVGRVDLSKMDSFHIPGQVDEAELIRRYLNKNHDFRTAVFTVQKRRLNAGYGGPGAIDNPGDTFCSAPSPPPTLDCSTGLNRYDVCDAYPHWFPNVQGSGQDYLFGTGSGKGWSASRGHVVAGIGATSGSYANLGNVEVSVQAAQNNFVDFDSRVVFVTLYGSYIGAWDATDSLLRAPLANPYVPTGPNPRYGYGLVTAWEIGPAEAAFAGGKTVGEAYIETSKSQELSINHSLLGDPTLRMHPVPPPSGLTGSVTVGNKVQLSWVDTPGASGYKIYRAPTRKGPYTFVQDAASGTALAPIARPGGSVPDSFYMVRAVRGENAEFPSIHYQNMSVGSIKKLASSNPSFLAIQSQPKNVKVLAGNPASLSVDALGINAVGNEAITYQWWGNGSAIPSNHPSIRGGTSRAISIDHVTANEAGSYYAVLTVPGRSVTSQQATLSLSTPPVPQNDAVVEVALDRVNYLDVLSNDWDAQHPLSSLEAAIQKNFDNFGAQSSSYPIGIADVRSENGKLAIRVTENIFRSQPDPFTFTYGVSDGAGSASATAQIRARPYISGSFALHPPVLRLKGWVYQVNQSTADVSYTSDFTSWTFFDNRQLSDSPSSYMVEYPMVEYPESIRSPARRFYSMRSSGACPSSAYGYMKKTFPPGWSTVGVPLDRVHGGSASNTLARAFSPDAVSSGGAAIFPDETKVLKWVNGSEVKEYILGPDPCNPAKRIWKENDGRLADHVPLNPGEGVHFFNPGTTDIKHVFTGSIPDTGRTMTLPIGQSLVSSGLPLDSSPAGFGIQAQLEDQIHRLGGPPGTVVILNTAIFDGASWIDSQTGQQPTWSIEAGNAFIYFNAGTSPRIWAQTINICPPNN